MSETAPPRPPDPALDFGGSYAGKTFSRGAKIALISAEILFIAALLVWWMASPGVRQSKNLWVMFFYCFPSEFAIALAPHEPVIIYFAKFYPALLIALINTVGTTLTEIINYNVFGHMTDTKAARKLIEHRTVRRIMGWFGKKPFLVQWLAGFLPVPFYPVRFIVVACRYPMGKYLLAVITSRAPRFFLLAVLAKLIAVPDWLIIVIIVVIILAANVPLLLKVVRKRRARGRSAA